MRGLISNGPMIGRLRISTFVISERRDIVYDGSQRGDNPLDEHTSITVPVVSVDFRVTPRFGPQGSTAIPFIARTGIVRHDSGDLPFRDEVRALGIKCHLSAQKGPRRDSLSEP